MKTEIEKSPSESAIESSTLLDFHAWKGRYITKLMNHTGCTLVSARQSADGAKKFWKSGETPEDSADAEIDYQLQNRQW